MHRYKAFESTFPFNKKLEKLKNCTYSNKKNSLKIKIQENCTKIQEIYLQS